MPTALRSFVALALLSAASSLWADTVTVHFAGTIDLVDAGLSSKFSTGQGITGSFTYDSATAPRAGSTATQGVFDALDSVQFSSGTYSASSLGAPEIQLDNDLPGFNDRFGLVSRQSEGLTGSKVGGRDLTAFAIRLDDTTNTALTSSLSLPTSIDLDDYTSSRFFLFFGDTNPRLVSGTFSVLQSDAVPEPASVIIWGIALVGSGAYAALRRRRRSNA
jgi:hypothetical protein